MEGTSEDWSPADHPYAIAVSEARWWLSRGSPRGGRLNGPDDPRAKPVSSRQIDARNLVLALAQLLNAEHLEQFALQDLGMDATLGSELDEVRSAYVVALPGIQEVRNAIT